MAVTIATCVRIALDGVTLRLSVGGARRIDTGTLYTWSDRVTALSVSTELGAADQALQPPSTCTITIDDADGWIDQYLPGGSAAERWINRRVDVYTGGSEGGNITAMDRLYSGYVPIGGLTVGRTSITLRLADLRDGQDVAIGGGVITSALYPAAPDSSIGLPIPWIIGDYTALTVSEALPAVSVSGETGNVIYKIGSTPLAVGTLTVWVNGVITVPTSINYPVAQFTMAGIVSGDVVTCSGTFYAVADGGAASWHPVDVVLWILQTLCGVAAGDIDAASFVQAKLDGDAVAVRRYAATALTAFNEINELCFEAGYNIWITGGRYTIMWFSPIPGAATAIGDGQIGDATLGTEIDPDRMYCNRLTALYDNHYGGVARQIVYDDTTEQASFGRVVNRDLIYDWLYGASDVTLALQRRLYYWRQSPATVSLTCQVTGSNDALYSLSLQQNISITSGRLSAANCWVRSLTIDAVRWIINVGAVNLGSVDNIGVWDAAVATVPGPGYWGAAVEPDGVPDTVWW